MAENYQQRNEFIQGIEHFNAQLYYEAHDLWEELWNELSGDEHIFVKGLIQVSVGLYHATNENYKGSTKMFASAVNYLETSQEARGRVNVHKLIDCMLEFQSAVERVKVGEKVDLPYFRLPVEGE